MEQKSHKKVFTIIATIMIAALFVFGIVFTLIKNNRINEANKYNQSQSQIDKYLDDLEKQED